MANKQTQAEVGAVGQSKTDRKQAKRGRTRPAAPDLAAVSSTTPDESSPEGRIEARLASIEEALAAQVELHRIQEKRFAALAPERADSAIDEQATPPLIAFVHIPKTAGGTATSMFTRAYSRAAVHSAGNYVKGQEKSAVKIARRPGGWERWVAEGGRVTVGHTPYGLFREHLPADTRYMTFLREPVDRVISHYHRHVHGYDRSRVGGDNGDLDSEHGSRSKIDSIEEALVELRLPQLSNLATRFLCGHPSPLGELPPDALEDAKANLRKFAFVGIQERFGESMVLLQRMLGLGLVPYLNQHVSSDRPSAEEIGDEQRKLIEEHNQLDAELYSWGRKLFDEAVAAADEELTGDVETLSSLSAKTREQKLEVARDWLNQRLSSGSTESKFALARAARAEGVDSPEFRQVLKAARSSDR